MFTYLLTYHKPQPFDDKGQPKRRMKPTFLSAYQSYRLAKPTHMSGGEGGGLLFYVVLRADGGDEFREYPGCGRPPSALKLSA